MSLARSLARPFPDTQDTTLNPYSSSSFPVPLGQIRPNSAKPIWKGSELIRQVASDDDKIQFLEILQPVRPSRSGEAHMQQLSTLSRLDCGTHQHQNDACAVFRELHLKQMLSCSRLRRTEWIRRCDSLTLHNCGKPLADADIFKSQPEGSTVRTEAKKIAWSVVGESSKRWQARHLTVSELRRWMNFSRDTCILNAQRRALRIRRLRA